jgi:DNA polymerase III subunit alpha
VDNYIVYHLHSDESNPTAGTGADSATKFTDYLDRAAELGMKAIAFSEHGNIFNWVHKKQETENRGLKYIHANEVYLTEHIDKERGLIRDNFHFMLIAKNWEGVKELNKLSSKAFDREDGHFYYNPRITFDELFNTSDNIIMTSACLASPLWRAIKNQNDKMLQKFMDFFVQNKHRMFFEIQYHNHPEQVEYNQWLLRFSKETGIPLIAGTDTHALNKEHLEARKILMMAKNATYGDEDTFDLTFKSYEELVEMFKKQNALPRNVYLEAIHNTNVLADMIEEFELDKTPKYPRLYENSKEVFKEKINLGVRKRGIDKFPKEKKKEYYQRIHEEFETYEKLDVIDYMLLQKNIIDWCHENGIYQGYGRGSVNGSLIAYVLGITEMDSIKHKLNFWRFLNPDRISLPDIDIDYPPTRRQEIIDYLASLEGIDFAEIITFNTIALKGAIREVGRALKVPLSTVDEIAKSVDAKEDFYREKYPKLFKYVDLLMGTIVSVGSHPSGFLVSPVPLDENIGLFYTSESKYPVSQINMRELEDLMYVKLDVLGLDNIEIINETCKLAGIERLTPDNVDIDDKKVWDSLKESTLGVFQWESDTAFDYIKRLFSKETIEKIKEKMPDYKLIDLMSVGNGAIRPSGASFRDKLANGEFNDNGHEGLNELLKDSMGYLVYQEQIIKFLNEFCGFSPARSDLVRRGLAKKKGTQQYLPAIREGFIKTMTEKYGETKEHAEEILQSFLKVIEDASNYGFSVNHSQPYSYIGYINAYLRYYYPLEYLTVMLNVLSRKKNEDAIDKTAKAIDFAKTKGIEIKPIKFGKSSDKYTLSKEENAIYKGLESIKHLNSKIAHELLELSKNKYNAFVELLIDIVEKTSVNTKQLDILIRLNFFEQFGKPERLLAIYNEFENGKNKYKKTYVENTKQKRKAALIEYEKTTDDMVSISPYEQVKFELDHLGYVETTFGGYDKSHCIVMDINTKYSPRVTLYQLCTGNEIIAKVQKNIFYTPHGQLFKQGDLIQIKKAQMKPKMRKVNGEWETLDEKELWINSVVVKEV